MKSPFTKWPAPNSYLPSLANLRLRIAYNYISGDEPLLPGNPKQRLVRFQDRKARIKCWRPPTPPHKVGRGCYGFNQLLSPTKTIFKSRLMQLITNSKWICSYVDLTAKSSVPPGQRRAECKIEHTSCWKYEIEQNRAKCKSGRKSLPQRLEPPIRALQVLCFPPLWLPKWPPTLTVA